MIGQRNDVIFLGHPVYIVNQTYAEVSNEMLINVQLEKFPSVGTDFAAVVRGRPGCGYRRGEFTVVLLSVSS